MFLVHGKLHIHPQRGLSHVRCIHKCQVLWGKVFNGWLCWGDQSEHKRCWANLAAMHVLMQAFSLLQYMMTRHMSIYGYYLPWGAFTTRLILSLCVHDGGFQSCVCDGIHFHQLNWKQLCLALDKVLTPIALLSLSSQHDQLIYD